MLLLRVPYGFFALFLLGLCLVDVGHGRGCWSLRLLVACALRIRRAPTKQLGSLVHNTKPGERGRLFSFGSLLLFRGIVLVDTRHPSLTLPRHPQKRVGLSCHQSAALTGPCFLLSFLLLGSHTEKLLLQTSAEPRRDAKEQPSDSTATIRIALTSRPLCLGGVLTGLGQATSVSVLMQTINPLGVVWRLWKA